MDRLVVARESSLLVTRPGARSVIEFMRSGIPGQRGAKGDQGISGSIGDVFTYTQDTPSDTWIVNHNLNRTPAVVRVLSPGGVEVEANVVEVSLNQVNVLFAAPQLGSVLIV